jgi:hypothetical protein
MILARAGPKAPVEMSNQGEEDRQKKGSVEVGWGSWGFDQVAMPLYSCSAEEYDWTSFLDGPASAAARS